MAPFKAEPATEDETVSKLGAVDKGQRVFQSSLLLDHASRIICTISSAQPERPSEKQRTPDTLIRGAKQLVLWEKSDIPG